MQIGDRVAATKDGVTRKGRIATLLPDLNDRCGVTFSKHDKPIMFLRSDVIPLYRYVKIPAAIAQGMGLPEGAEVIQPLLFGEK